MFFLCLKFGFWFWFVDCSGFFEVFFLWEDFDGRGWWFFDWNLSEFSGNQYRAERLFPFIFVAAMAVQLPVNGAIFIDPLPVVLQDL